MIAVVLLAHGSPERLDDLPEFLTRVRRGRAPAPDLVAEVRRRYALVGPSPLLRWTRAQAEALAAALGPGYRTYVGMRLWAPEIEDAVADAARDGAAAIVGLPMAPQFSTLSTRAYHDALVAACRARGAPAPRLIGAWHDEPLLHAAFAEALAEPLARVPDAPVAFTAHSLPARVAAGDPYPEQVRATAEAVAARAGVARFAVAFQSAGLTPEPWLGPDLKDVLAGWAAAGTRAAIVAPVGFVCDHVEILYDLDVDARAHAAALGLRLARMPSLNARPALIAALAAVVRRHAAP